MITINYRFLNNDLLIQAFTFLLFIVIYIFSTTSLLIITPKSDMNYDERWQRIRSCFFQETGLKIIPAKAKLKRDLLFYRRKSEPWKIINLLWGGVVVGAVASNVEFQKAIYEMHLKEMSNINPLATICIIILLIIYLYYFFKYEIPVAWISQTLSQIDLEAEAINTNRNDADN